MSSVKWIGIIVLVAVVVGALTGFGGYRVGYAQGQTQALAARNRFFQDRGLGTTGTNGQGAGGAAAAQGAGGNRGNFAFGQVKQVSGDTIEISTAQNVVTVKVNSQTQYEKPAQGSLSDITPGERVTVQGDTAADGTITARSIQIGVARGIQVTNQ